MTSRRKEDSSLPNNNNNNNRSNPFSSSSPSTSTPTSTPTMKVAPWHPPHLHLPPPSRTRRFLGLGAGLLFVLLLTASMLFLGFLFFLQTENPCLLGRNGRWGVGLLYSRVKLPLMADELVTSLFPALSCADVSDAKTMFVADPFLLQRRDDDDGGIRDFDSSESSESLTTLAPGVTIVSSEASQGRRRNGRWFLFFEIWNTETAQGDIAMAWAEEPLTQGWRYQQVVLDEPFHLSYPFVFHFDHNYYMIPETFEANAIRLYKASPADFPHKWTFVKPLLEGLPFIDTSPLLYEGVWYLFAYLKGDSSLRLYHSDSRALETCSWKEHPASPIYVGDRKFARPGGRPFVYRLGDAAAERDDDVEQMLQAEEAQVRGDSGGGGGYRREVEHIFRFAQDNEEKYGHFVHVMKINVLTPTAFQEEEVFSFEPIPELQWISQRTHHLDLHFVDENQSETATTEVSTITSPARHGDGGAEHDAAVHLWMGAMDGSYHFYNPDQVLNFHYFGLFAFYIVILALYFIKDRKQKFNALTLKVSLLFTRLCSMGGKAPATPSKKHLVNQHSSYHFCRFLLLLAIVLLIAPFLFYSLPSLSFHTTLPSHPVRPTFPVPPPVASSHVAPVAPYRHSSSPDSSPCGATVVTGLYDIGRGDPSKGQDKMQLWSNYLHYFDLILSVNSCLVVHVDPSSVDFVLQKRKCHAEKLVDGVDAQTHRYKYEPVDSIYPSAYRVVVTHCRYPTEIIVTSLKAMIAESKYLPVIRAILASPSSKEVWRPNRVERRIPEYNMIMFSKLEWVMEAVKRDPFHSKYFFWMDGGYGKGEYFNEKEFALKRWPALNKVEQFFEGEQFLILKTREFLTKTGNFCANYLEVARKHRTTMAGGFYGGTKRSVTKFYDEHKVTLDYTLANGIMDDDQLTLLYTWCRRPDLVYLHRCVHENVISQAIGLYPRWRWGHFHCPVSQFLDASGSHV